MLLQMKSMRKFQQLSSRQLSLIVLFFISVITLAVYLCASVEQQFELKLTSDQFNLLTRLLDNIGKFKKEDSGGDNIEEEKEVTLKSGYLKSMTGHCAYIDPSTGVMLKAINCTGASKSDLTMFEYTSHLRVKAHGMCLTQYDGNVFLDLCYKRHHGQRWSGSTQGERFFMGLDDMDNRYGVCLYIIVEGDGTVKVASMDCWYNCEYYRFRPVTWWIVDSPDREPPQWELDRLEQLQHQPWQKRYCLKYSKGIQE